MRHGSEGDRADVRPWTEEATVRDLMRALGSAVDERELLNRVSESALQLTEAFGAYVERIEFAQPGSDVEVIAVAGAGVPDLGTRVPYPGSLTEEMINARETHVMVEVGAVGERMAPYLQRSCEMCTALIVPLSADAATLGALVLLRSPEQRPFSERETDLAAVLGDAASTALQRVLLLEQLKESEERFRALAENAAIGIFIIDERSTILFSNRAGEEMFGYPPGELLGENIAMLMTNDQAERHAAGIDRYLASGRRNVPWEGVELPGLTRDRQVIPLEISFGEFVRGGAHFFTGIVRDVSERKRLEAVARRDAALTTMLRQIAGAATEADSVKAAIQVTIDQVCAFTGWPVGHAYLATDGELRPTDLWHFDRPDRFRAFRAATAATALWRGVGLPGRVFQSGRAEWTRDVLSDSNFPRARVADDLGVRAGFAFPVNVDRRVKAVLEFFSPDPSEPDDSLLAVLNSVSAQLGRVLERKEAEENRERLLAESERGRAELQRVTESRARLMRGFTHDVKNPLGAAGGHLELLAEGILGDLTARQSETVVRIRRSLGTALRLVDDLLQLAEAEAGQLAIDRTDLDVRELVRHACHEFRAAAEAKGLSIDVHESSELPLISSDRDRLAQVLANLISNAIKYTDRGGVALLVESTESPEAPSPGSWIAVDVVDTGRGIAPSEQKLLFQEFTRLSAAQGAEGAGIGLAISRRIARALGGDITVSSEVGRGSRFRLWLPAG